MGLDGISIWQLLIVLAIVLVIFGTRRIKNVGGDLGAAIKNFRNAVQDGREDDEASKMSDASPSLDHDEGGETISEKAESHAKEEGGKNS